jgi:quinol monooxygenase YgiN
MSIRLLVKFTAVEHQADTLVRILQGAKPMLLSVPGCEAVEVLHGIDDPNKVVLSEVWQSKEIHDRFAATQDGSSTQMAQLITAGPDVEIFDIK